MGVLDFLESEFNCSFWVEVEVYPLDKLFVEAAVVVYGYILFNIPAVPCFTWVMKFEREDFYYPAFYYEGVYWDEVEVVVGGF